MPVFSDAVTDLEAIGARPIPEFEGLGDVWPRGARLEAIRSAAEAFRVRFKTQGEVLGARSVNIAAAPYPARYAFGGAAVGPNPMVSIINRMIVVQYEDFSGVMRTLVWEPTVAAGSAEAPFYAKLAKLGGEFLSNKVFSQLYNDPEDVLPQCGLTVDDVDYASFDHLHVQDPRMLLGTTAPFNGEAEARPPLFPNAKFIVQRKEVATLDDLHPMQWAWYVEDGLRDAQVDRFALIEGDVELGKGVAIVWTPGHTDGNHSLVLNTPDGVWVSSENGVSADNWHPEHSKIPGVRRHAEFFGREVILNSNTLEDSLDQYDSMIKEKTIADPLPSDPRWRQVLPSSELSTWKRHWPVVATHTYGGINYGTLVKPAGKREAAGQATVPTAG